jgi:phosphatidylcholine synthase
MTRTAPPSPGQVAAAWAVHLYTALGLPLAVLGAQALWHGDGVRYFLLATIACLIDASDGFLARRAHVKTVVPHFNGRRLDDIVDYIHFTALPLAALPALGLIPEGQAWLLSIPMMASAYGFCQEQAKTEDAFVGFPSYWNIFALYFFVLDARPVVILGTLGVLSLLVFVPVHYVYPSRTRLLQKWTVGLGVIWTLMVIALALRPEEPWAKPLAWVSLYYPVYYTLLSFVHHARIKAAEAHAG